MRKIQSSFSIFIHFVNECKVRFFKDTLFQYLCAAARLENILQTVLFHEDLHYWSSAFINKLIQSEVLQEIA